mmetsp:Transcript_43677/g.101021  ORF Transcript_43677/g.101021 Transcript_43677/m.101021 type:complete len:364 (+) Transcript_43677:998-2089(+)
MIELRHLLAQVLAHLLSVQAAARSQRGELRNFVVQLACALLPPLLEIVLRLHDDLGHVGAHRGGVHDGGHEVDLLQALIERGVVHNILAERGDGEGVDGCLVEHVVPAAAEGLVTLRVAAEGDGLRADLKREDVAVVLTRDCDQIQRSLEEVDEVAEQEHARDGGRVDARHAHGLGVGQQREQHLEGEGDSDGHDQNVRHGHVRLCQRSGGDSERLSDLSCRLHRVRVRCEQHGVEERSEEGGRGHELKEEAQRVNAVRAVLEVLEVQHGGSDGLIRLHGCDVAERRLCRLAREIVVRRRELDRLLGEAAEEQRAYAGGHLEPRRGIAESGQQQTAHTPKGLRRAVADEEGLTRHPLALARVS